MLRVHDDTGMPMAATFDLEIVDNAISLILYSAGGVGQTGGVARNADYAPGLEAILRRLGQLEATLSDAYVDSSRVRDLPLDERRLNLPEWPYPVRLADVPNFDALRKAVTGAQKAIGKSSGGNERKRIRLQLEVPGFPPTSESTARLGLILSESQTPTPTQPPEPQASGSSSSGQGFITDTPKKLAIEAAAMTAARKHYEDQKWTVIDVSADKVGYDLLCERDNKRLGVEVKGTTAHPPKSVLVTANEVSYALANIHEVALFVLSGIVITTTDGVPVATGGTPTVFDPWPLALDRLTPKTYSYALDGLKDKSVQAS